MDKLILMPNQWMRWTRQGFIPLHRAELPRVFCLILCPELYLQHKDKTQSHLSDFQNHELSFLAKSSHGILRLSILGQFTQGATKAEVAGIPIWFYHDGDVVFQCTTHNTVSPVARYLKRFDITYAPSHTPLKHPSLWQLMRTPNQETFQIPALYHRALKILGTQGILGGACFLAMGAIIGSGTKTYSNWQEIRTFSSDVLTKVHKDQAQLFQIYKKEGRVANPPDLKAYDQFVADWAGRVVVTTVKIDDQGVRWQFILHPDHQGQAELIADWVDSQCPQAVLSEPDSDGGDYALYYPGH